MVMSPFGEVVAETWREQTEAASGTKTDEWIVMPNHFHAIVLIEAEEGGYKGFDKNRQCIQNGLSKTH